MRFKHVPGSPRHSHTAPRQFAFISILFVSANFDEIVTISKRCDISPPTTEIQERFKPRIYSNLLQSSRIRSKVFVVGDFIGLCSHPQQFLKSPHSFVKPVQVPSFPQVPFQSPTQLRPSENYVRLNYVRIWAFGFF